MLHIYAALAEKERRDGCAEYLTGRALSLAPIFDSQSLGRGTDSPDQSAIRQFTFCAFPHLQSTALPTSTARSMRASCISPPYRHSGIGVVTAPRNHLGAGGIGSTPEDLAYMAAHGGKWR